MGARSIAVFTVDVTWHDATCLPDCLSTNVEAAVKTNTLPVMESDR